MRTLIFLMCIGILLGCRKDNPDDRIAYYKFSDTEFDRIPKYKEGDTLVYRNQSGKIALFQVIQADIGLRRPYQVLGFFGYASYYYYDIVSYRLNPIPAKTEPPITPEHLTIDYLFLKEPLDIDSAKYNTHQLLPARFHGQVHYPRWNGIGYMGNRDLYITLPYTPRVNPDVTKTSTSLSINNKFYPEVVKLTATHPDTTRNNWDVHTLYYAFKNGIIGFDDVLGNQWRLQ